MLSNYCLKKKVTKETRQVLFFKEEEKKQNILRKEISRKNTGPLAFKKSSINFCGMPQFSSLPQLPYAQTNMSFVEEVTNMFFQFLFSLWCANGAPFNSGRHFIFYTLFLLKKEKNSRNQRNINSFLT